MWKAIQILSFLALSAQSLAEKTLFVRDDTLPNHFLSVDTGVASLGVDTVQQYSGYLQIENTDKYLFYWFFESRNDPKSDPVVLWLNGGPGCSSLLGALGENGPSTVNADLTLQHNPYSWNSNASMLYLDQPVGTGFSYSSQQVNTSTEAAVDSYAFLQLFFKQFPQYSKLPFHISGESFAGHYLPALGAEILSHDDSNFKLESVLIGNGVVDPLAQNPSLEQMSCGQGGYPPVLDDNQCEAFQQQINETDAALEQCYKDETPDNCANASINSNLLVEVGYGQTGLNYYDIRGPCEVSDGNCYHFEDNLQNYLNQASVQSAIGARATNYQACDTSYNFFISGDYGISYAPNITYILEKQVPVLIYAGDKDVICNWLGNHAWTDQLPWSGHDEFYSKSLAEWSPNGTALGQAKSYGGFTFLRVYDAGHMVPHDQPISALTFFNTWIGGNHQLFSP